MKRITLIAGAVAAVLAIVAPTATAGNGAKSRTNQARVHVQPTFVQEQGGQMVWRAGNRLLY
jgi:hypothetical protein